MSIIVEPSPRNPNPISDEVEISVRLPSNTFESLHVAPHSTILNLQCMIEKKFGIPCDEQKLYHMKTFLEPEESLEYYNLLHGATIRVVKKKYYKSINSIQYSREYILMVRASKLRELKYDSERRKTLKKSLNTTKMMLRLHKIQEKTSERRMNRHSTTARSTAEYGIRETISQEELERKIDDARFALLRKTSDRDDEDLSCIKQWFSCLTKYAQCGVSSEDLDYICMHMRYKSLKAGDFIFREGESGNQFYIILTGSVSITLVGYGRVATLGVGCTFGELAVMSDDDTGENSKRTASAITDFTTSTTELVVIGKSDAARSLLSHLDQKMKEKMGLLSSTPYFDILPIATLTRLAYLAQFKKIGSRKRIITQGSPPHHFYLLVHGKIKMTKKKLFPIAVENQEEVYCMDLIEPPQVFGEECCEDKHPPYDADVDTVTECIVLELPVSDVSHIICQVPSVLKLILLAKQERHRKFESRLNNAFQSRRRGEVVDESIFFCPCDAEIPPAYLTDHSDERPSRNPSHVRDCALPITRDDPFSAYVKERLQNRPQTAAAVLEPSLLQNDSASNEYCHDVLERRIGVLKKRHFLKQKWMQVSSLPNSGVATPSRVWYHHNTNFFDKKPDTKLRSDSRRILQQLEKLNFSFVSNHYRPKKYQVAVDIEG